MEAIQGKIFNTATHLNRSCKKTCKNRFEIETLLKTLRINMKTYIDRSAKTKAIDIDTNFLETMRWGVREIDNIFEAMNDDFVGGDLFEYMRDILKMTNRILKHSVSV